MTSGWTERIAGFEYRHRSGDEIWMRAWDAFGAGEPQLGVFEREGALTAALPIASRRGRLPGPANCHAAVSEPAAVDEAAAEEIPRAAFVGPEVDVFPHALPDHRFRLFDATAAGHRRLVEAAHTPPVVQTAGAREDDLKNLGSSLPSVEA
jgi:hypothetical protein